MLNFNRSETDTSVALDGLRAVAAQMVCVGHALVFFGVGDRFRPPNMPYMQNVGVLLFFIMSGFWISATLQNNAGRNNEYGFPAYFIDRFARIYSALVPALVLIAAVDAVTLWLTHEPTIARYYNFKTLVANLAMLEGYRGVFGDRYLQWSVFGSASPLWTLAIEWHIYVFAGAIFFLIKGRGSWRFLSLIALFFGQTPLHLLFGSFQPDGLGTGLFALWLGGAFLYLFFQRYSPPLWISLPVLLISCASYFFVAIPGHEYRVQSYPFMVSAVGALIAITQRTHTLNSAHIVRVAADYSFTLYLIHHTIIIAIVTTMPAARGPIWFWIAVAISNVAAYLLARPFEMKHKQLARRILAAWKNAKISKFRSISNPNEDLSQNEAPAGTRH